VPIPARSGIKLPLTVGEKGVNWRRLVIKGTPGHGSMPFRTDNALVTAAEVVRRVAVYQPKAQILDEWRRYVAELELAPELEAALTDPDRVLQAVGHLEPLGLARLAHACTHTTFSPNVVHGGSKINVIPDRIAIDVDVRALPGVTPLDVDAMLKEAVGDLASRAIAAEPDNRAGWHLWALAESNPRERVARWQQVSTRFPQDQLAKANLADNAAALAGAEHDYQAVDLAIDTYEQLLAVAERADQRAALEKAIKTLKGRHF
jgi:acetylornithine deacetylase/succinyl-diaminopimelate desuccinylase-like protein